MIDELISVIIPVYNREEYLSKCIDSVIKQDNVRTEIILVDDGSVDGSPAIIDDYAERFSNIIAVHQKNAGLSGARNAGLDICTGDYIYFLDSDDYIVDNALFKLLEAIKKTGADICVGSHSRYYEDGKLEFKQTVPGELTERVISKEEYLSLMYLPKSFLWCLAWGKLYKREIFSNIRFPLGKNSEDEYIMPLIMEAANSFYILDEELYHQTLSAQSITRASLSLKTLDATEATLVMTRYLLNKKYNDFALFRFGLGTRWLMEWKRATHDTELLLGIKRQYKEYRILARRLIPCVSIAEKVRMLLFCVNFDLYTFVRNSFR